MRPRVGKLVLRLAAATFYLDLICIGPIFSAEVYFSPGPNCESKIAAMINKARSEVVAAVYAINNEKIIASLRGAKARGVRIQILTDAFQAAGRSSKTAELAAEGFTIRVHSHNKIMHNKFAIVDQKRVVTGSFNWTEPAANENAENCILLDESAVVRAYKAEFDKLWASNSEAASRRKLARIAKKQVSRGLAGNSGE